MVGAGSCHDRPFSCKAGVAVFELPDILNTSQHLPTGNFLIALNYQNTSGNSKTATPALQLNGLSSQEEVGGFDSHRGQNIFSLPRVVPCFPLLGLTPSGLFMGLCST